MLRFSFVWREGVRWRGVCFGYSGVPNRRRRYPLIIFSETFTSGSSYSTLHPTPTKIRLRIRVRSLRSLARAVLYKCARPSIVFRVRLKLCMDHDLKYGNILHIYLTPRYELFVPLSIVFILLKNQLICIGTSGAPYDIFVQVRILKLFRCILSAPLPYSANWVSNIQGVF